MVNIVKSKAPEMPFKYNDAAVVEQIRDDFFVLCYICEDFTPRHFEVDHFYPQKHFSELENSWDNLFYSCQKCNKIRPKNINTTGNEVLNNCTDDVENIITIYYDSDSNKVRIRSDKTSRNVKNTIDLLNKIYNGIDTTSKDSVFLRNEIKNEIADFNALLEKNAKAKGFFKNAIKQRLSKKTKSEKSSFVSFKRQIIKESFEYKEFIEFFD